MPDNAPEDPTANPGVNPAVNPVASPPKQPTPKEELEALQGQLATATADQDKAATAVASLGRQIKALVALIDEEKKVVDDYHAAHPAIETDWTQLTHYKDYEKQKLEAQLGPKVADIRTAVEARVKEVTDAEKAKRDADAAVNTAQQNLDDAAAALKVAQQTDDEYKAFTATVKDRLAKLEKIQATVNASQEAQHPAIAYWQLVLQDTDRDGKADFDEHLDRISPLVEAPDDLAKAFEQSRRDLSAATETLVTRQHELAQAKDAATAAAKAADDAVKALPDHIRADLEAIANKPVA